MRMSLNITKELDKLTARELREREEGLTKVLADSIGPGAVDPARPGELWALYRRGNATAIALVAARQEIRHRLVMAPLPTFRRIQPKTWAGALITRDDFDLGRQGARRSSADGVYAEDMVTYFPDSHQGV